MCDRTANPEYHFLIDRFYFIVNDDILKSKQLIQIFKATQAELPLIFPIVWKYIFVVNMLSIQIVYLWKYYRNPTVMLVEYTHCSLFLEILIFYIKYTEYLVLWCIKQYYIKINFTWWISMNVVCPSSDIKLVFEIFSMKW